MRIDMLKINNCCYGIYHSLFSRDSDDIYIHCPLERSALKKEHTHDKQ